MADNQKYYYMRLKENFFETESMIVLESMPDGYLYSNILLKLYLRSLKNEGRLMFNDRIPYNPTILAQITRHSVGVVEKAIEIFKQLELIEILDNGAIYLLDIQEYIGRTSTEADRKRAYRNRIAQEKTLVITDNGQVSDKCPDKTTPEIELEKEIEIYKDIVEYLNQKAGTKYKHTTKATQRHINGRLAEGYILDDFKAVINKKVAEWKDTDMAKYLRPETLFGTKFEGYLNQKEGKEPKPKSTNKFNQFPQREYTSQQISDIERKLINKGL